MSKRRYAIGVVTIVGVLGVTAYSIYLYKKQKEEMSLEEARELVSNDIPTQEEIDEALEVSYEEEHLRFREALRDDIKSYEGMKTAEVSVEEILEAKSLVRDEDKEDTDDDYEEEEESIEDDILSIENRGDRELRHDPNSAEAMTQFMRMELAEFLPTDDTYTLMMKLYDIPFVPTNDGDNNLFGTLVDYRAEFFGDDSIWNQRIAFSDVIAHYARKLDYNLDQSYAFWMVEILAKSELDDEGLDNDILETMVEEITRHDYYAQGWDAHGLFALESPEWTEVQQLASQHIDNAVTFELEYNVFVKQYMMN